MSDVVVIPAGSNWRREFMARAVPFVHVSNGKYFDPRSGDDAPLIVYVREEPSLLFAWGGGSLLEIYRRVTGSDSQVLPLELRQVTGATPAPAGELVPAGGGWPTESEIVAAAVEYVQLYRRPQ